MIVFGPVPSRRLGRSLGVNNIIPKFCSYSCVYCQLGITKNLIIERRNFYILEKVFDEVRKKVEQIKKIGESIDYITFVPDGEPTLDINIGKEIEMISSLKIPIAVITNGSLLFLEDVRKDLQKANIVSIKIDTVNNLTFKKLNRPNRLLSLDRILDGFKKFAKEYKGRLITETMLVKDLNDSESEIESTALFIEQINPFMSYISIPTRPPAIRFVEPPNEEKIINSYLIFKEIVKNVSMLIEPEEGKFTITNEIQEDLLSIMSVHPMREDEIYDLLEKRKEDYLVIQNLLDEKKIKCINYKGKKFYIRNFEKV
ncbi:MAG: radical SAM protein [Caldisericia bacterium]